MSKKWLWILWAAYGIALGAGIAYSTKQHTSYGLPLAIIGLCAAITIRILITRIKNSRSQKTLRRNPT
jgi:hypothetical protein